MTTAGAPGSAWAAEQLTAFLSALEHVAADEVCREGVERAAEALEGEVAALIVDGAIEAVVGFPRGEVPHTLILGLARARASRACLKALGECGVLIVPFDSGTDGHLLVIRAGTDGWSLEERNLLRGMSRVLALSRQAKRTVAALQERQALLERLTRIQRSITSRAPLPEVLEAVVSGASELLGDTIVAFRRIAADDPSWAEVLCSAGVDPSTPLAARIKLGEGAGGRAIAEDRLVVLHNYEASPDALHQFAESGLQAAMAAPVHEDGVTVGSLAVASFDPDRRYSTAEQETLLSFADHASLAVTDARMVQALRQSLHDARHDAMHDELTGLPNRALLRDRLAQAAARTGRHHVRVALVYIDLDGFKHVNDSLGHDMGDDLLIALAGRFVQVVRESDTVARLGGDEFAVLLEDVASLKEATEIAERLLEASSRPVPLAGRTVSVSASIGLAVSEGNVSDSQTLLRDADLAMYESKRAGGGRAVLFVPDMHRHTLDRLDTEHALRQAISDHELVLHYQPIYDINSRRVVEMEALVRWQHPTRGLLPPAEFIPVAESSRLINALGAWVLRAACAEAAGWPGEISVAVNLSPLQVDQSLAGRVLAILRESGLAPNRLTLEVTESVAMADAPETLAVIQELHDAGIQIAIDDFGTGYSSLGRLRSLPVNVVKIDRSFVASLADPNGAALISAIVALCRGARLTTVAEGVETAEQLLRLREHGCDRVQGYLLGSPAPAKEIRRQLAQPGSSLPRPRTSGLHRS